MQLPELPGFTEVTSDAHYRAVNNGLTRIAFHMQNPRICKEDRTWLIAQRKRLMAMATAWTKAQEARGYTFASYRLERGMPVRNDREPIGGEFNITGVNGRYHGH